MDKCLSRKEMFVFFEETKRKGESNIANRLLIVNISENELQQLEGKPP